MKTWALAATALLHGALLAALVLMSARPDAPRAVSSEISVRLIAAQQAKAQAMLQPPKLAAPISLATPSAFVLPAPSWTVAVQEAAPAPAPATPVASVIATLAPPIAGPATNTPPPAPEAAYQAAAPADRQCAADSAARHYPALLRERGIEGRVLLRVRIDEQGRATEVRVQDGSGYRLLDEAAQRVTQGCRFTPARRGEQALASWVIYPVRFALN